MEYTTNYHLPQWVESDRIMMGDFNDAMSGIDGGINEAKSAADAAQTAADTAQETADSAQATADAAQAAAAKLPYAAGHYTGTNAEMTITLGFRPSFVIISGATTVYPTGVGSLGSRNIFTGGNVLSECITFTDTGFILHALEDNVYPQLVRISVQYDYIAFR